MRRTCFVLALLAAVFLAPTQALAYVGPGSGITAIGVVVAFVASIFFAIVGFAWYPLKRLWRAFAGKKESPAAGNSSR
jgi:hypothetical protein